MVVGTTTLYHLDLDNEELETVQVYVNKDAASKEVRLEWVLWLKLWIVPWYMQVEICFCDWD